MLQLVVRDPSRHCCVVFYVTSAGGQYMSNTLSPSGKFCCER